jgi:hypothetical protein
MWIKLISIFKQKINPYLNLIMKKQMVDIYFEELMMVFLHAKRISVWLYA